MFNFLGSVQLTTEKTLTERINRMTATENNAGTAFEQPKVILESSNSDVVKRAFAIAKAWGYSLPIAKGSYYHFFEKSKMVIINSNIDYNSPIVCTLEGFIDELTKEKPTYVERTYNSHTMRAYKDGRIIFGCTRLRKDEVDELIAARAALMKD